MGEGECVKGTPEHPIRSTSDASYVARSLGPSLIMDINCTSID